MVGIVGCRWSCNIWLRLATVPLRAPEGLEEGDRDQAAGVGKRRIAGFIPIRVVLAADDVEKVSTGETQLLI